MVLGYLISPVVQIVDSHGKPIVGAKIYVYKAGTTNTVNTYRDFSNHYNPTPVLTNTLGNCTIIAPDDMIYDIVVKDNRNNLLMSKDNLTVSSGINPDINLRFREGYGIIIRKNGNTVTIAIDTDVVATKDDLATKQDKLTAGDNIDITNNNIINVVNRKTLYTQWPLKVDRGSSMVKLYLDDEFTNNYEAGTGISIDDNVISCTGDITPYTAGNGISIDNHVISYTGATTPIYLDTTNFPIYYSFTSLDGQTGDMSWLNVPDATFYNGIVKDNDKNCYALVDQSTYKMCEVDADFVIKIDAMPSNLSIIDIEYGGKPDKSVSSNTLRNVLLYNTGIYYIHYHCIFSAKEFYFCGANRSFMVGGGTASIYLQNVTIRCI